MDGRMQPNFLPVVVLVQRASLLLLRTNGDGTRIVTPFMDAIFGVILTRTLFENLLSVIVTHSNGLLMSPDTTARVWNL